MRRLSKYFALFVFWSENIFYIWGFWMIELTLAPFLYLMVCYNVIVMAPPLKKLPYRLIWMVFGILYMTVSAFMDSIQFLMLLCD